MKIIIVRDGSKKQLKIEAETLAEAFNLGELFSDESEKVSMSFDGAATLFFELINEPLGDAT